MRIIVSLIAVVFVLLGLSACGVAGNKPTATEPAVNVFAAQGDISQLEALYEARAPYYGDLHNHSDSGGRSDGKIELRLWPTLVMDTKQMDFAAIVDHKQSAHMRLPEWDEARFIGGTEAATTLQDAGIEQGSVHYNVLFNDPDVLDRFLKENYEYNFRPDTDNPGINTFTYAKFTTTRLRELAQDVLDRGGFFVHVHPNFPEYLKSENPLDYWFGDYTGYEVMTGNGKYNMSHESNMAAYNMWVTLLNMDKILYATYGSDDHAYSDVPSFSTIYADAKNNQNFLHYVRKGDFTAGPVGIRMAIGDTTTGGQTDFAGKRLVIAVGDFHPQAIKKDHQYRLDLYNETGLVFSQEFDSAETAYFAIDAEECKYYRADVYDVTEDYIFAVGNPIWNK